MWHLPLDPPITVSTSTRLKETDFLVSVIDGYIKKFGFKKPKHRLRNQNSYLETNLFVKWTLMQLSFGTA